MENEESQLSRSLRTETECTQAIQKCRGNVTQAAKLLNIDRRTLTRYISDSDTLKDVVANERACTLDKAEQTLADLLDEDDPKIRLDTAKYLTATLGKAIYNKLDTTPIQSTTNKEDQYATVQKVLNDYFNNLTQAQPSTPPEPTEPQDNPQDI